MTPRAASGRSQNPGSDCCSSRAVRWASLPETSKRVSEIGEAGGQVVGATTEVGVHRQESSQPRGRPHYRTVAYPAWFGGVQLSLWRRGPRVMGKLAGKMAVVTGGGSGVGKAVAGAFLAEGASVVIACRD